MFDRSRLTIQPVTERKTTYYPVRRFREAVSEAEQNFIDILKTDRRKEKGYYRFWCSLHKEQVSAPSDKVI